MRRSIMCSRIPTYAKVIIVAIVLIGIITGLVFVFKARHIKAPTAATSEYAQAKLTPFSVTQILARNKATKIMSKLELTESLKGFANNMFVELTHTNVAKNVIVSPFSIHTTLGMARMGAVGETADEMDVALNLTAYTQESVAHSYLTLLNEYDTSNFVHMANKIYVNKNYELQADYKQLVSQSFLASADAIDFTQNNQAANEINAWVELKTNHLIQNIVTPDMLNSDTMSFLLSAIHFQDEWKTQFDKDGTEAADFYVSENKTVRVQMMHKLSVFGYERLPEIDANMVRLPYKNSNLSMVILLPNTRAGLPTMLEKLGKNFGTLSDKMRISGNTNVDVYLPKFRAEYNIELTESLKKMGMKKAFVNGEFSQMLKNERPLQISKVVHKAFIDVDEIGTKAAAATGIKAQTRGLALGHPMNCDHPFYYMIVNPDFVPIFQGVIVDF